jgi:hypothetical protein
MSWLKGHNSCFELEFPATMNIMAKGKEKYSFLAILSFVCGLLFLTPLIGGLFGIAAIFLGIKGIRDAKKRHLSGGKLALAGIAMGSVGVFGMITFYGAIIFGLTLLH